MAPPAPIAITGQSGAETKPSPSATDPNVLEPKTVTVDAAAAVPMAAPPAAPPIGSAACRWSWSPHPPPYID